ncbi:MAG: SAM-dependent methyltransferase [Burkholderiales bacterium]|nr:MAG: SAM-dependent methyltransferase [Burkholderiales bacterium]
MTALPSSPAADRNKQPILETLKRVLPERGMALEIASGTGQHATWFAAGLPLWQWQPTDMQASAMATIAAWTEQAGTRNVLPPMRLDVTSAQWPDESDLFGEAFGETFDAVYCANMLHIAPWAACSGLMQGAARVLAPGGVLVTYGPYIEDDVPTSPGNLSFDESLRSTHPDWGIRRLADVVQTALQAGLHLRERHAMPANNLLLVWCREPSPRA